MPQLPAVVDEQALESAPDATPTPGEVEAVPAELQAHSLLGHIRAHISTKIVVPFVLVMFAVAIGGTYVVLNLVTSSLAQRFTNQLMDAGRGANEGIIAVEGKQLEVLRLMANTEGVEAAVQQGDAQALQQLLVPLQANSDFRIVDVLDSQGRELLALRPDGPRFATSLDPAIASWDISRRSLAGEADSFGNKWSALVETSFGVMLYTAGPITSSDGQVIGAMLVGVPLQDLIEQLSKEVVASTTVYTRDGDPLASTLPFSSGDTAPRLPPQVVGTIFGADPQTTRRGITVGGQPYMELVGGLMTRDTVTAGLGVALRTTAIDESARATRIQLTLLFTAVTCVILVLGLLLARHISRPVVMLVDACRSVARGRLDTTVAIEANDETGILAHSFNNMIAGLREREKIRDAFGRYMTQQVSEAILKGDVKLGGETREITLLMSDIRGFTTLTEGMAPDSVVTFLNRYFGGMVECVLDQNGVVDKFMGDAILAVFGAPVKDPEHAVHAVLAALAMRDRLKRFNDELISEGHAPIRIGIGINTGPVVTGNIGSELRMEYTVIGDPVNATQRTEDLTKTYKSDILVTETTAGQLDGRFILGTPIRVTLRGRREETSLYPLIGLRTTAPAGWETMPPLILGSAGEAEQQPGEAESRVYEEVDMRAAPSDTPRAQRSKA